MGVRLPQAHSQQQDHISKGRKEMGQTTLETVVYLGCEPWRLIGRRGWRVKEYISDEFRIIGELLEDRVETESDRIVYEFFRDFSCLGISLHSKETFTKIKRLPLGSLKQIRDEIVYIPQRWSDSDDDSPTHAGPSVINEMAQMLSERIRQIEA